MENDSTIVQIPEFHIVEVCSLDEMPLDSAMVAATTILVDTPAAGKPAQPRPTGLQPDSWLLAGLLLLMTLIAAGARTFRHIFGALDTELLGVRRRANAFESHTSAESRTLLLMVLTGCFCQAILVGYFFRPDAVSDLPLLLALTGVTVTLYLFQVVAYNILGFTFTDKVNKTQLLKGLNLSQGLTALLLLIPTFILLFYHNVAMTMLIVAGCLYILGRIAFICKGFRIFYNGLSSLVYFILYLCALEIIPVIIVGAAASYLCSML